MFRYRFVDSSSARFAGLATFGSWRFEVWGLYCDPVFRSQFMPAAATAAKTTFTITRTPRRPADQKTILRLMRMQREVQNGLRRLAGRRRRDENVTRPR